MFTAIGINLIISLASSGIGAFAHWLIGKHTKKSAIAAAAATAAANSLAGTKVPLPSPTKAPTK